MRTQSWGHTAWLKVLSKTPVLKSCPWGLTSGVCLSHSPRVAWLRPAHGQEEYSSGCLPALWAAPACSCLHVAFQIQRQTQDTRGCWHPSGTLPPSCVCLGPSSPSLWWQRLSCHCPRVESTGSWIRGMRMCKAGRESLRKLLYIAMLPGACSPRKAQVQTPKAPPWVVHQGLLTLESPCSLSAAQQSAIEQ